LQAEVQRDLQGFIKLNGGFAGFERLQKFHTHPARKRGKLKRLASSFAACAYCSA
jgi:hypothetical protein